MGVSSTRTTLDKHKIRVYNSNSQPSTRNNSYNLRRQAAAIAPAAVKNVKPMVKMTAYGNQWLGQSSKVVQTHHEVAT